MLQTAIFYGVIVGGISILFRSEKLARQIYPGHHVFKVRKFWGKK